MKLTQSALTSMVNIAYEDEPHKKLKELGKPSLTIFVKKSDKQCRL